jgi:hypothetical protein
MSEAQLAAGDYSATGEELGRYRLSEGERRLRLGAGEEGARLFDEALFDGGRAELVDGRWREEAREEFLAAYLAQARRLDACPVGAEAFWLLEDEAPGAAGGEGARVAAAPVWQRLGEEA